MINKGPYTIYEMDFTLRAVPNYNFDQYAQNIARASSACAALQNPVLSAVSTDMGRQVSADNSGGLHVGAGFPLVVAQAWYNAPAQSTEYFARQTCGHVLTVGQLPGRYAKLTAGGLAPSNEKSEFIVTQGGAVCKDALQGVYAIDGIPVGTVTGQASERKIVLFCADNYGGVSSGGTLTISGSKAVFTYDRVLDTPPIITAELTTTGTFVAAVLSSVTTTEATIIFRTQDGNTANFPGGRLAVSGLMIV